LKISFLNYLQDIGCAETEAKTVVLGLEAKIQIDCYKCEF